MEDFGWSGDEFLIGDCQDDWRMDMLDIGADEYEERQRQRDIEETKLEFADEANDEQGHERDLFDIVNEHDEEAGESSDENDEYLNCDWRE
jgi:hypothetical protein